MIPYSNRVLLAALCLSFSATLMPTGVKSQTAIDGWSAADSQAPHESPSLKCVSSVEPRPSVIHHLPGHLVDLRLTDTIFDVGQYDPMAFAGDYFYVSRSPGALEAYDISDPHDIRLDTTWHEFGNLTDIEVAGDRAYLAVDTAVLFFDVSNPLNPVRLGSIPL